MIDIPTLLERAAFLIDLRKADKAEPMLQELFGYASEYPEIAYYLCWCKLCLGKVDDALRLNDFLLKHSEIDVDILRLRYTILLQKGDLQEAEKVIALVLEMSPEEAEHWKSLAYLNLLMNEREKCVHYASKVLSFKPEDIEAMCYKALALSKLGKIEQGRIIIKECLRLEPNNSFVFCYAGWVNISSHEVINDYEAARKFFKKSLVLDPDNKWAEEGLYETVKPSHPFPNQLTFGFVMGLAFLMFFQLTFFRELVVLWFWIDMVILVVGIGVCIWANWYFNKKIVSS